MNHRGVAVLWTSLCLSGCTVFDDTLLSGTRAAVRDGDCVLRVPPARPNARDGNSVEPMLFAAKDVVLDQGNEAWRQIGYDLDGICSTTPTPRVECMPPALGGTAEIDGDGGIDNVFGHQLLAFALTGKPDLDDNIRLYMTQGLGVVLLRLREWNGRDDDPHVEVAIGTSVYGTPGNPDGSAPADATHIAYLEDGGVDPPAPSWDGRDYFWGRTDSYVDGDETKALLGDRDAYVAERTLVVRISERAPLLFSAINYGFILRFTSGIVTARISADRSQLENIVLAGRLSMLDYLDMLKFSGVCPGTWSYDSLARGGELSADVRALAGTGGPGVSCDAFSVGFVFETGIRSNWGGLSDLFGAPQPCTSPGSGIGPLSQ